MRRASQTITLFRFNRVLTLVWKGRDAMKIYKLKVDVRVAMQDECVARLARDVAEASYWEARRDDAPDAQRAEDLARLAWQIATRRWECQQGELTDLQRELADLRWEQSRIRRIASAIGSVFAHAASRIASIGN